MPIQSGSIAGVPRGLIDYAHWMYGLYALSVVLALAGAHTVALRYAFGLPSIIAVILGYARRSEARGSWLESHFRWQIRTFWYSWLWIFITSVVAVPLLIVLVGVVIGAVGLALIGIWVIYRIARGWLALKEGHPLPVPA